jgi:CheY-like chemotaxis protein
VPRHSEHEEPALIGLVVLDYRMLRLDGIGVAKRVLEANKWFDMWRVFEVDKDGRIQFVCDHINSEFCQRSRRKRKSYLCYRTS